MNKKILPLILALAPFAAAAHGQHHEPVPTVYYTSEAAYYAPNPVATEHVLVQTGSCGCCSCPTTMAHQPLPPRPVIVRSVMPMPTACGYAYAPTGPARYVEPGAMACSHQHTTACQHGYHVQHAEHPASTDEW